MPQNVEGFEMEQICAWVPCADYPREREKHRETEKHHHNRVPKKKKVHMHEMCMNMWRAKKKKICIMGSTQSKPISMQHINTHVNAWNIVKMQMGCNAWSYTIKNTTPNPKILQNTHQFSKTPKNSRKPKPRSKCVKCMKNEGLREHTRVSQVAWVGVY